MAETKLTAFRCPADLLAAIESEMASTNDGKTDVLVRRLRAAYGLSADAPPPSVVSEMQAAIAELQGEIEAIKKPLAAA
ncbi:hypothetical protein [Picosynechococcus sp. PCC 73109]|uniref:hypothetical protein n=1 Tax=Picosynechococcus sp. PCC 73109 TaxID=374982 RepID=UPI0007458C52|nr:hypothetical protein [Picosynechococcus sp. PCC 73109]AMA10634.1 hypothetical protein AWQ23_14395 [Picosynechococcus sp. PCC 73109]